MREVKIDIHLSAVVKGPTAVVIEAVKSWDGSYYAETNCIDLCGPNKSITLDGNIVRVNGEMIHGFPCRGLQQLFGK